MKFFIDLSKKQLIKSAASNVALERVVLKRRDSLAVEVVFVTRNAAATMPSGTTVSVALKKSFSDSNFLASASGTPPTLNLNTVPLEALFNATAPSAIPALLEIRWTVPGETTRTATLTAEVQNSVILGTEGTPESVPDLKATQTEAQAGTNNEKWMTPLRTAQAIAALGTGGGPVTWDNLTNKPASFPPASHTHDAAEITSGTLSIDRIPVLPSQTPVVVDGALADLTQEQQDTIATGTVVISADGVRLVYKGTGSKTIPESYIPLADITPSWFAITEKPSTFAPSTHNHPISEVTGLDTSLASLAAADTSHSAALAAEASARQAADISLQTALDGKAPSSHTHTVSQISDFSTAVAAAAPQPTTSANSGIVVSGQNLATSYNTTVADSVVSVAVGGAPAAPASSWKSKNIVQVLDDILFPTLPATVGTAKSTTLAVSGSSGTLEVGTSHTRTLTATFARGTILNGGGALNSNPLVGPATSYAFSGTGITANNQSGATRTFTASIALGGNNWAVTTTHSAGTGTYTDNKGIPGTNLDPQRAAGTSAATSSTPAITGVIPYFYLRSASPITAATMVAAIQNGTATKVVASSTGTLSIPYAPAAQFFAVAYPAASTTKTRYFVTALDNGAITVLFAPVATSPATTANWSNQSFKIHVSLTALTNSNATIELRNT